MKKSIYLVVALSLVLGACSVEKRIYNSGYHVVWKNKNISAKNDDQIVKIEDKNDFNDDLVENEGVNNTAHEASFEQPKSDVFSIKKQENISNNSTKKAVKKTPYFNKNVESSIGFVSKNKSHALSKVNTIKKAIKKANGSSSQDVDITLLYILCFFIPFLAVGLATDWDVNKVLINLLLSILCFIPAIIHAIIIVKDNR